MLLTASPSLTAAEERALAAAAKAGDETAARRLVAAHEAAIRDLARSRSVGSDKLEARLVAAATVALLDTVDHFDADAGTRLATQARPRVLVAVADTLAHNEAALPHTGRWARRVYYVLSRSQTVADAEALAALLYGMDAPTFHALRRVVEAEQTAPVRLRRRFTAPPVPSS